MGGLFRKDIFDKVAALKPGFIRMPGGNYLEGTTSRRRAPLCAVWGAEGSRLHGRWLKRRRVRGAMPGAVVFQVQWCQVPLHRRAPLCVVWGAVRGVNAVVPGAVASSCGLVCGVGAALPDESVPGALVVGAAVVCRDGALHRPDRAVVRRGVSCALVRERLRQARLPCRQLCRLTANQAAAKQMVCVSLDGAPARR